MFDSPLSPRLSMAASPRPRTGQSSRYEQERSPGYPSPAHSDGSFNHVPDALGLYGYSCAEGPSTPQTYLPSPQTTSDFWSSTIPSSAPFETMVSSAETWQLTGSSYAQEFQSPQGWHHSFVPTLNPHDTGDHCVTDPKPRRLSLSSGMCGLEIEPKDQPMNKVEDNRGWYPGGAANIPSYPTLSMTQQPMTVSPEHLGQFTTVQYPSSLTYPPTLPSNDETVFDSGTVILGEYRSNSTPALSPEVEVQQPIITSVERQRKRRKLTSPADANYSCCGKFFRRSYNFKQHQATHNPLRQKHACKYPGCDKRFVRNTDLKRHEGSVHLNVKQYGCPQCSALFARRDTLRRHIEDGCPRRFEFRLRTSADSSNSVHTSPASKTDSPDSSAGPTQLPMRPQARRTATGTSVKQERLSPGLQYT